MRQSFDRSTAIVWETDKLTGVRGFSTIFGAEIGDSAEGDHAVEDHVDVRR